MTELWKTFLQRVWGPGEGWAFIAFAGAGQFKHRSYKYPAQLEYILNDLKELNNWANIYFCPHLFSSSQRRVKEKSMPLTSLWVDKDSGPVEEIKPKPTICWRTSEGRHQAVWLLDAPADPQAAEKVNRFLTYYSKADKGGWHLGKVIRLPGSVNYKYQPPFHGTVLWDDGPIYNLEELAPNEPDELQQALKEAVKLKVPDMPDSFPTFTEAIVEYGKQIPKAVWELLKEDSSQKEDWSEELWKLERLLFEAGLSAEAVYAIAKDSPWNKYARDNRPADQLWGEVAKAKAEKGPFKDTPEELPWVGMSELMLYSERPEWMVEGIWMDKNVGWIAGVGKSYKSVISLDLALSIASGKPFLGKYEVKKPGTVLMVQEEDPVWRVAHRIQTMSLAKGISKLTVSHDDYSLVLELREERIPLFASVGGGFVFQDREKTAALERAIDRYRPKMVVLDPMFMMALGVDEYKTGDVVEMLNLMKRWRHDYGCSIAVIHHYNKGGNGSGRERLYGSQAFYAWSENSLFVTRESRGLAIERDIKDARSDTKILLDIIDIDDSYDFVVSEADSGDFKAPVTGTAYDKIAEYLAYCGANNVTTRKHISESAGVSTKTVSIILNELEEGGYITMSARGQGGQLRIVPTEKIKELKKEEGHFES